MPVGRTSKVWTAVVFLLLLIIIIGAVVMWVRFPHSHPVEISIESPAVLPAGIYVDGAVNSPGFYPLKVGDNLDTLLQMAGGTTESVGIIFIVPMSLGRENLLLTGRGYG